jgi:hypothetical protein
MANFKLIYIILTVASSFFILHGCGGGAGTPGSDGTSKTNVIMTATVTPKIANTPNVIFNCNYEDKAGVAVTATRFAPELQPGIQTIERYELRYFTITPGAPLVESFLDGYTTYQIDCSGDRCDSPEEPQLQFDIKLMDTIRKDKYQSDILSGAYGFDSGDIVDYVAQYKFFGQDQWGNDFSFQAQTQFNIGQGICEGRCLDNCAPEGACSGHGGVNCVAGPDTNGLAICNDGEGSGVAYQCR